MIGNEFIVISKINDQVRSFLDHALGFQMGRRFGCDGAGAPIQFADTLNQPGIQPWGRFVDEIRISRWTSAAWIVLSQYSSECLVFEVDECSTRFVVM